MLLTIIAMGAIGEAVETSAAEPATEAATAPATAPAFTEAQAIAALRKLGGKIKLEGESAVGADLADIKITDAGLVYLEALPRLKTLSLRHAYDGVTDAGFAHLKGLTALEKLDLWDVNKISNAAMGDLQGMAQLRELSIPGPIGDAGLGRLKDLPRLQTLLITGNGVSDAGLAQLKDFKSLTTLNFAFSRITDVGLAHLKGLTQLKAIGFGGAKVTDAGVKALQEALPDCKIKR